MLAELKIEVKLDISAARRAASITPRIPGIQEARKYETDGERKGKVRLRQGERNCATGSDEEEENWERTEKRRRVWVCVWGKGRK